METRPAIEGWFTTGPEPALVGTRCTACGTYHFPAQTFSCRNPWCGGTDLETVGLSRTGTVWSYTVNHYAPPPPYVSADPFEPFAVAAVELERERMIVLGQVVAGATIDVGTRVELTVDTLFTDEQGGCTVWKWKPVTA